MSEDDDIIQQPRNKTVVFTLEERKLLLKLISMHFDVLNNKKVDSASTLLKNQAWEAIHKSYLESTGLVKLPRTPQQLKRCWENMKCKAKKGDPVSVKLLRWGDVQYRLLQQGGKNLKNQENTDRPTRDADTIEDSDFELKEDGCNNATKLNLESQSSANDVLDSTLLKIKESLENDDCVHCHCDKLEKSAKFQLILLQKHQSEKLHQLQMQLTKEKIKYEKELHKLYIHEMTLKVENERRRAEILERELGA